MALNLVRILVGGAVPESWLDLKMNNVFSLGFVKLHCGFLDARCGSSNKYSFSQVVEGSVIGRNSVSHLGPLLRICLDVSGKHQL